MFYRRIFNALTTIERKIDLMATGIVNLTQDDTDLAAAVKANTDAEAAIVAELSALQQQLANVPAGDPDNQVASIAADMETKIAVLNANTAAMTAAITPATPATPPSSSEAPAQ